eukprot:1844411-Amphidinium_carterae.1
MVTRDNKARSHEADADVHCADCRGAQPLPKFQLGSTTGTPQKLLVSASTAEKVHPKCGQPRRLNIAQGRWPRGEQVDCMLQMSLSEDQQAFGVA